MFHVHQSPRHFLASRGMLYILYGGGSVYVADLFTADSSVCLPAAGGVSIWTEFF